MLDDSVGCAHGEAGRGVPAREARSRAVTRRSQVRREIDAACTAVIAVGFGLGYGAEAARQAFPAQPAPRRGAGSQAVPRRARLPRPPAIPGGPGRPPARRRAARGASRRPGDPAPRPARVPPSAAGPAHARPGTYRASEETIQSWLLRRDINVNTLNRFGRLWVRNLCRNMGGVPPVPGRGISPRHLRRAARPRRGRGAVAGRDRAPSLAELRERMLVVSVNTPLRACRERGVEPDFTVVVDPQYWASRSLDWTLACGGVLVAEPSTCPRVFRREEERFFLCSSLFPLGETLEDRRRGEGEARCGRLGFDLGVGPRAAARRPAPVRRGAGPGIPRHAHPLPRARITESMWLSAADRFSPLESGSFRIGAGHRSVPRPFDRRRQHAH